MLAVFCLSSSSSTNITKDVFCSLQVIIPLLNTLHRLHHTHHIIHRDIKPENLLLTGDGELRLADFGTAIKHDNEVPFLPVGTLDFMAPEVLGSPAPKGAVESPCITADMLHELNICPYTEKVQSSHFPSYMYIQRIHRAITINRWIFGLLEP